MRAGRLTDLARARKLGSRWQIVVNTIFANCRFPVPKTAVSWLQPANEKINTPTANSCIARSELPRNAVRIFIGRVRLKRFP